MYLLQRLALLLAGLACALVMAFGLFRLAIELGHSPLRYVVQDVAVALAGAIGLLLCWRWSRRLRARRLAQESRFEFQGHHFEARARTSVQVLGVVVLVALSAGGLALLLRDPNWKPALIALIFAVVAAVVATLSASLHRGGRPALTLDGHGLDHAWFGRIPWDQVHGLQLREVTIKYNRIYSILLGVSDPDRFLARMPAVARLVRGKFGRSGRRHGALEIPLNPLDKPAPAIFAAARTLRERVAPAPIPHWHPGMTDEEISLLTDMAQLTADMSHLGPEEALRRMQAMEPRLAKARERTHTQHRTQGLVGWVMTGLFLVAAVAWLWFARS